MDNQGRNLNYNRRSKHLVPAYRICPQSSVQTQVQSRPWCQECILRHHSWTWRNEGTSIWPSLQWKRTQDPIRARSRNWLQALWLLVTLTTSPSILSMTTLEWIPAMVDTVPLIRWLVYVVLMKNFRCCQRIQQRQSYKLRVHGVNPQSPLKV
jgi:hypothetical protein